MAETEDLKSFQCRFESDWGHQFVRKSLHDGVKHRDSSSTFHVLGWSRGEGRGLDFTHIRLTI